MPYHHHHSSADTRVLRPRLYSTKMWRRKGSAHDSKHTNSSVKHGGGGVLVWACMAAAGKCLLIFTDVPHDGRTKWIQKNSFCLQIYREMHPSELGGTSSCSKMIQNTFADSAKYSLHQGKNEEDFRLAKSITRPKGDRRKRPPQNKQQMKETGIEVWKRITKEETRNVVMSMTWRSDTVVANKGYETKYYVLWCLTHVDVFKKMSLVF